MRYCHVIGSRLTGAGRKESPQLQERWYTQPRESQTQGLKGGVRSSFLGAVVLPRKGLRTELESSCKVNRQYPAASLLKCSYLITAIKSLQVVLSCEDGSFLPSLYPGHGLGVWPIAMLRVRHDVGSDLQAVSLLVHFM